MRHSQPGILLTLCAALAVASACTSDAGTNAVSEVDPGVFLTTRLKEKAVRLTGTIRDIVDDDLDAQWHFIVLNARQMSFSYYPKIASYRLNNGNQTEAKYLIANRFSTERLFNHSYYVSGVIWPAYKTISNPS